MIPRAIDLTLKGTEERLIKTGFDGYLTKPVKIRDLADELARVTSPLV
jgi:CheY-like chemotaxis protein